MDIRNAILAAADHIERSPAEFNFVSVIAPERPGCGTPGCAMGWIATFAGVRGYFNAAADLLGLQPEIRRGSNAGLTDVDYAFYNRMDEVSDGVDWRVASADCAATLRRYADRYHPAAEPAYPNWQAIANGPDKVKDSARDQALDWVRA